MFRSSLAALIKVGDVLPSLGVGVVTKDAYKPLANAAGVAGAYCTNDGIKQANLHDHFKGFNKAVLFGIPGAFTSTCSQTHLPGFVSKAAELKQKGVDHVACIAVNDAATLKAWGLDQKVGEAVTLLADGNGAVAKAMDTVLDLTAHGMGIRNKRFAAVVSKGKVTHVDFGNDAMVDVVLKHL